MLVCASISSNPKCFMVCTITEFKYPLNKITVNHDQNYEVKIIIEVTKVNYNSEREDLCPKCSICLYTTKVSCSISLYAIVLWNYIDDNESHNHLHMIVQLTWLALC